MDRLISHVQPSQNQDIHGPKTVAITQTQIWAQVEAGGSPWHLTTSTTLKAAKVPVVSLPVPPHTRRVADL